MAPEFGPTPTLAAYGFLEGAKSLQMSQVLDASIIKHTKPLTPAQGERGSMIWGDRRLRWVPEEALAATGPTQLNAEILRSVTACIALCVTARCICH